MVDETLARLSDQLFWAALLTYAAAMVAFFFSLAYRSARGPAARVAGAAATVAAAGGAAVHAASLAARGLSVERVPWGNMFEYSSAVGLLIVVTYLLVIDRRYGMRSLGGFIMMAAVLSLGSARLTYAPPGPLVPALNSFWLKIHVFAAMTAFTLFTIAFVVTLLALVKEITERRAERRAAAPYSGSTVGAASIGTPSPEGARTAEAEGAGLPEAGWEHTIAAEATVPAGGEQTVAAEREGLPEDHISVRVEDARGGAGRRGRLPGAATLDTLAFRTTAFAFPIWTFAVIAGAVWAHEAWGRYWGWDPKETWAFITWVLYAGYLHARATTGWRGRKAALIGIAGFGALLFNYYAVNLWLGGLHSYAGV